MTEDCYVAGFRGGMLQIHRLKGGNATWTSSVSLRQLNRFSCLPCHFWFWIVWCFSSGVCISSSCSSVLHEVHLEKRDSFITGMYWGTAVNIILRMLLSSYTWAPGIGVKGLVVRRMGWLYIIGWGAIKGIDPIWPIGGGIYRAMKCSAWALYLWVQVLLRSSQRDSSPKNEY